MNRFVFLLSLLLIEYLTVFGQERRLEISVGFKVGCSALDTSFGDNASNLAQIISLFEKIKNDSTTKLTEVTFSGSASPEGRAEFNRQLAVNRMRALEKYVRERVAIQDSIVTRKSNGIPWGKLAELVEVSDMPYKEDVLCVLRSVPENVLDRHGRLVDSRKKRLMELQRGHPWLYMNEHFFESLRNACTVMITVRSASASTVTDVSAIDAVTDSVPVEPVVATASYDAVETAVTDIVSQSSGRNPFCMSVNTNMLYDLLLLPNVGVEFHLGRNWSIAANWMYGWWNSNRRHRYWRAYGGAIALRKWFGRAAEAKPLTGHHLGVYGQLLTYDFEFGGKGQLGGEPGKPLWNNPSYAAGVEYGYSLPVAQRLNIDFTIGVGYFGGKYYEYEPIDYHYVWQSTKQRNWFGPTKAEISLVWLLGHGNRNERKGNER